MLKVKKKLEVKKMALTKLLKVKKKVTIKKRWN